MTAIAFVQATEKTARIYNDDALKADAEAARLRMARNTIIRVLRKNDPKRWTYAALGKAVGLTASQITRICKSLTTGV